MTTLADLQSDFQAFLLGRANGLKARVRRSSKANESVLLNVYRHAYRARLAENLGNDFPVLMKLLGEGRFDEMTHAYSDAHPSRHRSARWFGEELGRFLADARPYADEPALAEMAVFEWAQAGAFDAADSVVFDLERLTAIPVKCWPSLRFRFGSSLRRLSLVFDTPSRWLALAKGEPGTVLQDAEPHPAEWLIWRVGLDVRFRELEAGEAWALDAAMAGADFAAICEGLCRWAEADQAAFRAAGIVKGWIETALVEDVSVENQGST